MRTGKSCNQDRSISPENARLEMDFGREMFEGPRQVLQLHPSPLGGPEQPGHARLTTTGVNAGPKVDRSDGVEVDTPNLVNRL